MKAKKYALIGLGVILLFLIITNPSLKEFKESQSIEPPPKEADYPNYVDPHYIPRRDRNFFIFSYYTYFDTRYLAIAGNFFAVKKFGTHEIVTSEGVVYRDHFIPKP